ncbi:MAG: NAD-dependent succinate-semialdehyde dehydrogenase [Candidatus Fermentibacteraceae bacterium]|nr:NAD-dependent succinate-semialdehyde dehydrogenase [Candidatus Fermentibacteraceae bacterium]MBN2609455.1 NAD-dependent succinate-semialdehyde dehydrogenase [Candidatus Fermentibacteraceae bacterium]
MLESINPFSGKVIRTWEENTPEELDRAVEGSQKAFEFWRGIGVAYRAKRFLKMAHLLESSKHHLAVEMAAEMGKPVTQGQSEIEKCAWVCRYYAENSEDFLADEPLKSDADESYVCYQPLGVIYAVMPWNFPYWQLFRFAAPAVMAGNCFVLKHSPNVTGCALRIRDMFCEAGFPEGLASVILVSDSSVNSVSKRMIADRRIKAVTLTGSEGAGASIASVAGNSVKKCTLELGGSDPAIVLEDADLQQAASATVTSRLINSGQNCIASKRFIVIENVFEEFLKLLLKEMKSRRMGDPMDMKTDLGPLARYDLRDRLHRQVTDSIGMGAHLVLGGSVPDHSGAFYPATVLTGCRKGMPVFDQETFGPVAAVCTAKDESDAVVIANDTQYGLGASVFTRSNRRGERIALEINAGSCFVNAFVRSDPRLPFGGIGMSGYGRELSRWGVREFTNCKTMYIKES